VKAEAAGAMGRKGLLLLAVAVTVNQQELVPAAAVDTLLLLVAAVVAAAVTVAVVGVCQGLGPLAVLQQGRAKGGMGRVGHRRKGVRGVTSRRGGEGSPLGGGGVSTTCADVVRCGVKAVAVPLCDQALEPGYSVG
jgi:hypothetical protein